MSKRFSRRRISVADGPGEGDIGSSHLTSSIEGNAAGVKDASNRDTEEIDMKKISACGGEHHESPEEIISLESSLHPSLVLTPEDSACEGDVLDISLMLASNQKLFFKNFCEEFTAVKDVKKFLRRPTLLLALRETSLQGIVDAMLTKMIADHDSESIDFQEARMAFFTHDSVHCLSHVIQGTEISEGGGWEETQNWLVAMAELPSVQQHCVAIAQLRNPVNLGRTLQETHLVVLVLAPSKTKTTQSSLETGRTFATLLSDMETRRLLLEADTEEEFKNVLLDRKEELISEIHRREKAKETECTTNSRTLFIRAKEDKSHLCAFGRELVKDLKRRWPHYASDYTDGIKGRHTLSKLISTTLFLYFACLLPSIAFGVLNDRNTHGMIDVQKVIISQSVGGVFFAIFGGQPLIVLLTTAPLALYIKVIYSIAADFELDFFALYSCTGLWNSFFLLVYSTFGLSKIMKWSTRSTEEIFALFISLAFIVDAVGSIVKEYSNLHCSTPVSWNSSASPLNLSTVNCSHITDGSVCHREGGLAYAVVSFGTVCIGLLLYNSRKSPFLDAGKREALADYALVAAVLIMSLFASYFVRDIDRYKFNAESSGALRIAPLGKLTWGAVFAGCGLGFSLSLLFFMDQNISSAMVNNPRNRLKKGCAYHLDLLVVAVLNGLLSLFGLPWLHAALPHSPLHVRALADVEERVDRGHVFENIVKVRETRLSGLLSNILIALSLLMLPTPLTLIPTSVLDGLFLFVAITSLYGNQMFERALLLFTEQCAYPPNHYIRHVPERKIHLYTAFQFLQLAVLCGFGFAPIPYLKMVFPVLLMLILPVRQLLVPKIILSKYLDALDAHL